MSAHLSSEYGPVATIEPRSVQVSPPVSETGAIVSMIERAARDPSVDIDKLQQLMAMRERVFARNAKAAYAAALATMQPELPVVAERGGIKDKSGKVQSTYAKWEDINEAIKPVLARHGFALSFRTGQAEDGRIVVTGVLSHREGHVEETTMVLPHDSSGSKNAVQAVGSSTSYGKRYTAAALLNLTSRAVEDRDDDGAAAGVGDTITDEQAAEVRELIEATGSDIARFCRHLKIEGIATMPAARYGVAVAALRAKGAQR